MTLKPVDPVETATPGTAATARAAQVLLQFGRTSGPLGVSEIARALGMSKAVVHRILTTFVDAGLLLHDNSSRQYMLGPAAVTLGARAMDVSPLRRAARDALIELQRVTGETATVSGRVPGGRVYLDQVESGREIKMTVELGRRFPLHSGSSGQVILAYLTDPELDDELSRPLDRLTEDTVCDPMMLREIVRNTRLRGTARSSGQRQEGAGSIAAAIFGSTGRVVGALSVCGPAYRMTEAFCDSYEQQLLAAARDVSRKLGWPDQELSDGSA
jgi:DNA-binding IclR family transcriptional regulator